MIILVLAVAGGLWGAYLARSRDGTGRDIAQYAAAFAIAFAIVGLFLSIFIERAVF